MLPEAGAGLLFKGWPRCLAASAGENGGRPPWAIFTVATAQPTAPLPASTELRRAFTQLFEQVRRDPVPIDSFMFWKNIASHERLISSYESMIMLDAKRHQGSSALLGRSTP